MLKFIVTKDITYKGQLFKSRKIIAEEKMLALIFPLIEKAIFTHGWRSEAEQREYVNKGTSKTMDSNHRRGVCFDIWNWQECEDDMKKLGFINDLKPWDPGHFPFGGEEKARVNYVIINKLPEPLEEYKSMTPEHEKNYKKITKAVAKKVDYDYGDNPNDDETKVILKRLDSMPEKIEVEVIKKIPLIVESPDLLKKIENQTEMLKSKDEVIARLKEQSGGVDGMTITQLFKEIINKIMK